MILNIGGKDYKLHFGIDFIREIDKRYTIDNEGVKFGAGLQFGTLHLINKSIVVLADIILSATHTLKSIPSIVDIEDFLANHEDLDGLFNDFLEQLRTSPLTMKTVKPLLKEILTEN